MSAGGTTSGLVTPRRLDLDTWARREHFRFFRDYDNPFFNICAEVDVSSLLRECRRPEGPSFFLASFYLSLVAVNEVEEFHYRIRGDQVVVHDVIHGGSTVLRPDGTFTFAYFDFASDYTAFSRAAGEVLSAVRDDARLEPRDDRDDLVHYSVIPWISFTSFSHARRLRSGDSTPKVVFGRYHGAEGAERMPVSVEVHHALMDGLHVGRFFERYQHLLDTFEHAKP